MNKLEFTNVELCVFGAPSPFMDYIYDSKLIIPLIDSIKAGLTVIGMYEKGEKIISFSLPDITINKWYATVEDREFGSPLILYVDITVESNDSVIFNRLANEVWRLGVVSNNNNIEDNPPNLITDCIYTGMVIEFIDIENNF